MTVKLRGSNNDLGRSSVNETADNETRIPKTRRRAINLVIARGGVLEDVLGLGLEASSPRKLACPRLEDSSIFLIVKILWSAWKIFWKTIFCGDRLKNFCEDLFFFFWRALALVSLVLGLGLEHSCPWPRECLSSASRVSVLGKAVLGLGLGFFLCPWPWPRALCPRLHLW